MRHLALVYALCAHIFSLTALAETAEECLQSPLLRESDLTCVAPPKVKKAVAFKDEKWEWKGEKSDAWDGPYDCVEDYCVYVNRKLNGLVLISAEQNVHVIDRFPVTKMFEHDVPPFYAAEIPGKGIGLIANRTIRKNEIIMHTTPAMLIQFGPHIDFDGETRLALYERAVERIRDPGRRALFKRQYGEDTYMQVDRNAFRLFINGEQNFSGHLGVYPDVSRMNHDCRPNVHYRMDNITHISIAVRDIAPGEELTVSYIDGHLSRSERQTRLSDWGFTCTCPHCSMSADEVKASDQRMERIYAVEEELEKVVGAGGPIDTSLGDELVRLYEEEKFESYIGQAYTRAALLHSLVGNREQAVGYASKAYEAMVREHGEWNKDAKAMKMLAEEPSSHWSWEALKGREKKEKEKWEEGVGTQVKVEMTGEEKKGEKEKAGWQMS